MQRVTIAVQQISQATIGLTDAQVHYLQRVLRLGEGDRFIALDGEGQGWVATLQPNPYEATIIQPWQVATELPIGLHLIVAMPKTGMDDIVRQTTELGVTRILPVTSDRTILNPSPQKVERWRRIAKEAMEQSERQHVPVIGDPQPLAAGLTSVGEGSRWICVARQMGDRPAPLLLSALLAQAPWSQPLTSTALVSEGLTQSVKAVKTDFNEVHPAEKAEDAERRNQAFALTIAVGPEGGWSPAEVGMAIALGYQPVTLGPRILRTVTAPLAAISIIAATLDHQQQQPTFPLQSMKE